MSTQLGSPTIGYLAIGDELLDGRVTDTNVRRLAHFLTSRGARIAEAAVIGDAEDDLIRALSDLAERCDIVVTSGGLGPTTDDRTRHAVARVAGVPLEHREDVLERIRRRFDAMGRDMAPENERQALVPVGADVIPSSLGTADPFRTPTRTATVACLPGVPREFGGLLPDVLGALVPEASSVACRTLRAVGIGESTLASHLEPLVAGAERRGLGVSYLASYPTITVRFRGDAALVAEADDAAREALADWLLPDSFETPEAGLIALATARGVTLAAAESCTGGGVVERWTRVAGASAVVRGGAVTYATDTKTSVLGVSDALIAQRTVYDEAVAAEMAEGARRRFRADLAIATTGIAGPDDLDGAPPVGTVYVAVASGTGHMVAHACFGRRGRAAVRASAVALATTMALRALEDRLETVSSFAGVQALLPFPAPE